MNILVLCTGNSARSILLESIFNTCGGERVKAWSAGSNPTGKVHPKSLELLGKLGHDTSSARSKSWDEFATEGAPVMDLVITVCGSAAGETCPTWPGTPLRAHWGVDDPAAAAPTDQDSAFSTAYRKLQRRARAFFMLEFETMERDELQSAIGQIGQIP